MIIAGVMVDWVSVWEPGSKGKFGACVILKDNDPQLEAIRAELAKQTAKGISMGKFTEAQSKAKSFLKCLRDGSEEVVTEGRPQHYMNTMFFNANNKQQPGIVGPNAKPLMDQSVLYSGCICNVDVNFFPYNNESKGIGCALNNIMLVKSAERLDGRVDAATAFNNFAVPEDNLV